MPGIQLALNKCYCSSLLHSILLQGWHTQELDAFYCLGLHSNPTWLGKTNNCENLLIFKHTESFFLRTTAHIWALIICQAPTGSHILLQLILTQCCEVALISRGTKWERLVQDLGARREQSRHLTPARADLRISNCGLSRLCWDLAQAPCDFSPVPTPLPLNLGFAEVGFEFYLFFKFSPKYFLLVLADRD